MTQTTLLSTRIAALESLAAPLPELRSALDVLNVQRDELITRIAQGEHAAQQLDLIGLHVGGVLDGTATMVTISGGTEASEETIQEAGETGSIPEPEPALETAAEANPVPEVEVPEAPEVSEPVPVETEVPEAPVQPEAEAPADPGLSVTDRVLAYVTDHPGKTALEISSAMGLTQKNVASTLSRLNLQGRTQHDESWPYLWSIRVAAPPVKPEPAPVQVAQRSTDKIRPPTQMLENMLPIPNALGLDDRTVFDALRREIEGLTRGVLISRLNWSASRVDRAANSLTQAGHIGLRGNRYVAIPAELADEVAS